MWKRLGIVLAFTGLTLGTRVAAIAAIPGLTEPLVRQPVRPAWEIDVTDRLEYLGQLKAAEDVMSAKGEPYATAMTRDRRSQRLPTVDQTFWCKTELALPSQADPTWPVVVEFDQAQLVPEVWFDREHLARPSTAFSTSWQGGEGSVLLPLTQQHPSGTLAFRAGFLQQLYENGFGRVRVRPADIDEVVHIDQAAGRVNVANNSTVPLELTLHAIAQDFFGTVLAPDVTKHLTIAAKKSVEVPILVSGAPSRYKTRIWVESGARRSLEYWRMDADPARENWSRDNVIRLENSWEWQMSPGPLAATPPADGWEQPVTLPHAPPAEKWKSHWMWYRTAIDVPASGGRQRLQLFVPRVNNQAVLFVDGKRIGEYPCWELPKLVTLPSDVEASGHHQIAFGVTDYIVALAPGVSIPSGGKADLPSRGLAAPLETNIGMPMVPELIPVPEVRADWVGIRTKTEGGIRLDATIDLQNDSATAQTLSVVTTLLDRGRIIATVKADPVRVEVDGHATALPVIDHPSVELWEPDFPHLYELRTVVKNAGGETVDTRRDRFGFREFGIDGDHFILNGKRIDLIGGSHINIQTLVWPARPHAYRLVRYGYPAASRFMSGRAGINLADEVGMFVKCELWDHGALGRDRYAYQLDETWDRIKSTEAAVFRTMPNHPSLMMWDIGNELWFAGKGEPERMVDAYNAQRKLDPTRLVTNGGGAPTILPGAELLDWHGWPTIDTRSTWQFFNPEKRPAYWKTQGFFARRPTDEPAGNWTVLHGTKRPSFGWPIAVEGDDPLGKLTCLDGRPILFSEGQYYEDGFNETLTGLSGRVPIPGYPTPGAFERDLQQTALNYQNVRKYTVQNMRLSRVAATMIHVDRGIGKWVQPLVIMSVDRNYRFAAGEHATGRYAVFNDVSGDRVVHARWTLFDGDKPMGEKRFDGTIESGGVRYVDLDLPLPERDADSEYRLHMETWADGFGGYFRDDVTLTAFAREHLTVPAGQTIAVLDPVGTTAAYLKSAGVQFASIQRPTEWTPSETSTLLVGSEGLAKLQPPDLSGLRNKAAGGGRIIVLDHHDLPAFLRQKITQSKNAAGGCYAPDPLSPITHGLTQTDMQFWRNRDQDWLVTWGGLEVPTTGNARVYFRTESVATVLEVAEGTGRVLFCQLNLQSALGIDPAAARVLQNLLNWTATPSPFARLSTLLVSADARFINVMRSRVGLNGDVTASLTPQQLAGAKLLVVNGTEQTSRDAVTASKEAVKTFLDSGGTLYVQGLTEDAGAWLTGLGGQAVRVKPFIFDRAWLTSYNPLTAGMGHTDFWWHGRRNGVDPSTSQELKSDSLGRFVVEGVGVRPLVTPAYLGVIDRGSGRIIVDATRPLEYPVTRPITCLSQLLSNAGATLTPGGIVAVKQNVAWDFSPIDLQKFANHSLSDDPAGRRGWHQGGPDNDMRMFPRGRQDFHGVTYDLIDPDRNNGNGVIALAGSIGKGVLPSEIKGIPVHRKAERLYFLHNAAWGRPGFTYRVYYTDDRKNWIFGKADPFVDVVVNPKENIADWWGVDAYERGDAFLPGATVAWAGQNPSAKAQGNVSVGVFQMIWDNPHPEKEIESIDILSPGTVGGGQVFVFGITAATRKAAAQQNQISLGKLLPKGVRETDVLAHVRTERYGLAILRDGRIAVVHDWDGNPLYKEIGWHLQGQRGTPTTGMTFFMFDEQNGKTPRIEQSKDADGNVTFSIPQTPAKAFGWRERVVCKPSTIVVEQFFTVSDWPSKDSPGLFISVGVDQSQMASGVDTKPNLRPVTIGFKTGIGSVDFDERFLYRWYQGYSAAPGGVRFSPFDRIPTTAGSTASAHFELSVP